MNVVLFDGVCALCDASVRTLLRIDRQDALHFAPLQGETAKEVLGRHGSLDHSLSTVLYVRELGGHEERVFERSDAAAEILRDVGLPWSLLAGLRFVPRPLRDAVYAWVARHRYRWFGKYDACQLPGPELSDRFLP